jgi:hypothetical protein
MFSKEKKSTMISYYFTIGQIDLSFSSRCSSLKKINPFFTLFLFNDIYRYILFQRKIKTTTTTKENAFVYNKQRYRKHV